jgi:phosphotriesterase-related protein
MPAVSTATGAVDTALLGRTLMHEHVFILDLEMLAQDEGRWDEEKNVADAVARLQRLKAHGIDTIVDLTVMGLGRYVPRVARVAREAQFNVIVSTGIYTFREMPHWFKNRVTERNPDFIADYFTRDVEEGIGTSGVRAAVLKCVTDTPGVTDDVDALIRATARAHRHTGAPISTHSHAPSGQGLAQQRILAEEGVDLSRVVIGHCGDTTDLHYLEQLLQAGSYLGMDRFGIERLCTTAERVKTITELCARGYANRLVLSHDANCIVDLLAEDWRNRPDLKNWEYTLIPREVVPALLDAGVTSEQVDQILIHNPRAIFERQGAY